MHTTNNVSKKSTVVPYRGSTLTWLLKDSLGRNSMTTLIATKAPPCSHLEQIVSTLRCADSTKKIHKRAIVNEDPTAKLIRDLKIELALLKSNLNDSASERFSVSELHEKLKDSESLLAEADQTWEEWLQKTFQKAREMTLEHLGISIHEGFIGLHIPKEMPYLVNLSEDSLLTECLIYYIGPGVTRVGNAENRAVEIKLEGQYILYGPLYV